jgi:hypothetical protein
MLQQDVYSIGNTLFAAVVAGTGSPALLYWAFKGRVTDWIQGSIRTLRDEMRKERDEKLADIRTDLTNDTNGLGDKYTSILSLYTQLRTDLDGVRDRCTKMEARQDPVTQGVERIEKKLDASLDRMEQIARDQAVQAEQIKTLFKGKP